MAKTASKSTSKAPAKPKKTAAAKVTPIEKAAESALAKLRELGLAEDLQADLEWCLGSFRFDQNPAGLIEKLNAAKQLFEAEKEKKTKGVTAKLISDLQKALEA